MAGERGVGDFLTGFFMGTLVGAAIALLFAPTSGEEIRTQIREKSIELKDYAEDLSEEAAKKAEMLRTKSQSLVEEQKARFREAVEEGKQAAARRKEELLSQFEAKTGKPVDLTEENNT